MTIDEGTDETENTLFFTLSFVNRHSLLVIRQFLFISLGTLSTPLTNFRTSALC